MKYLVLAALLVLLAACGSESDETTLLEGSWRSEQTGCVDYNDEFTVFGYSVLSFSGNAVEIIEYTFADEDCSQARSKNIFKGAFSVLNDVILASGETVTQIQITLISSQSILYLASAVEINNTDKECGFTDWEINVSKNTSTCLSTAPSKDIAKIEDNQLTLGDTDFLDEDGYPSQLDSESPLYKQ